MPVLSRNGNGIVNVIHHKHTTQKISSKSGILRTCSYQFTGKPDHSRLLQRIPLGKTTSSIDTVKWKERSTAETVFLQKFDHMLGSLFIVCDNVLNTSAKSRLNGDLILLVYLDQICYNTLNSRYSVLLFHYTADTVSVSVIALCNIFQRFQPGSLTVICTLADFHLAVLFL